MNRRIFLVIIVGLFMLAVVAFRPGADIIAGEARPGKYSPGSDPLPRYQDFLEEFKQKDKSLFQVYQEHGDQALYAMYRISSFKGLDYLTDYDPLPQDVVRLYELISGMDENYRQDYVRSSFLEPVSIIIGGSDDLSIDSLLYFVHISEMLNIPWSVINNNRNSKFSRESDDLVASDLSLTIGHTINQLITSGDKRKDNVWVDVETAEQLNQAVHTILSTSEYQLVNIFIATHGTRDSLIFSTASGNGFSLGPEQFLKIVNHPAKTNLFLGTCYSGLLADKMESKPNLTVISSSDIIAVDGDLTTALLLGLNKDDFRVNAEELSLISSQSEAFKDDNYCYYYYANGTQYRLIDDKVTHAHKMRFGYKNSDLDIDVKNPSGSSLLYFHTKSIKD